MIGDAAHGVHPVAGQGVNLAFRDVAALVEVLVDAARIGLDFGNGPALERYARWRRFDSTMSAAAYDGLNRVFSVDNAVLRAARGAGLGIVDQIPQLKQMIMTEAAGLSGDSPELMRGREGLSFSLGGVLFVVAARWLRLASHDGRHHGQAAGCNIDIGNAGVGERDELDIAALANADFKQVAGAKILHREDAPEGWPSSVNAASPIKIGVVIFGLVGFRQFGAQHVKFAALERLGAVAVGNTFDARDDAFVGHAHNGQRSADCAPALSVSGP